MTDFSDFAERPYGIRQTPAARIVDRVLVDPENPPDHDLDQYARSREELLTWWRLPYIVSWNEGYEVRVLYEGAHNRTVCLGRYDTVEAAAAAAKAFHDEAQMIFVKD